MRFLRTSNLVLVLEMTTWFDSSAVAATHGKVSYTCPAVIYGPNGVPRERKSFVKVCFIKVYFHNMATKGKSSW